MLSVAAGFMFASAPAFAQNIFVSANKVEYPSLKNQSSLRTTVQLSNRESYPIKVIYLKLDISGVCALSRVDSTFVKKNSPVTLTAQFACPWSKIVTLPGCGPKKSKCDVGVSGSIKYQRKNGTKKVLTIRRATLTLKKPGVGFTPRK